jgi:hypothetical protein
MISTSIIFSTGEKKWMPINWPAFFDALARPEIGSVEVFDAKMQSGRIGGLDLGDHLGLHLRSSNTASIMRSQSASAA